MRKEWHRQRGSPGGAELNRSSVFLTGWDARSQKQNVGWSCVGGNHKWPCMPICRLQLLLLSTQHLGCFSCNLPLPSSQANTHISFEEWLVLHSSEGIRRTNHTRPSPWWQGEPCSRSDHQGRHSYDHGNGSKMSLWVSPYLLVHTFHGLLKFGTGSKW